MKNHYPSYLPKNEILNEVKEKYYFEKFNKKFREQELMKEKILDLEEYDKKLANDIDTSQKTISKKINEKNYTKKEKNKIEYQKRNLTNELQTLEKNYKNNNKILESYKKGIYLEQVAPV